MAHKAVADQVAMAQLFLGDRRTRAPVVAIWVASFGGALHEPVTTFYMTMLGATTTQLGTFSAIRCVGAWILAPLYGWMLDRYSGFIPTVMSAFFCTLGCTMRGLAPMKGLGVMYVSNVILGLGAGNFWNLVGTYIACTLDRDLRPLVVSAFYVQVAILQLAGKLLYSPCDSVMRFWIEDTLLRYRITMSVCSLFCVFGVFNLLVNGRTMREVQVRDKAEEGSTEGDEQKTTTEASANPSLAWTDIGSFVLLASVLVVQAAGVMTVTLLWPLYVRRQFAWEDHAYALLSLVGSMSCIVAACTMPVLVHRVGAPAVATLLCVVAAVGILLGFPSEAARTVHVVGAMIFVGATAALKPCLESLATLTMPPHLQGRTFAALSLCQALGQTVGSHLGSTLFEQSLELESESGILPTMHPIINIGGGSLPFVAVGVVLLVAGMAVAVTLLPHQLKVSAAESPPDDDGESRVDQTHVPDEFEMSNLLRRNARPDFSEI